MLDRPDAYFGEKIWADGAYGGEDLAKWCEEQEGWELDIVERDKEAKGFEALPKRPTWSGLSGGSEE